MCVVQAIAHSGTFTLLMSGFIRIVERGPNALVVSESLNEASLSMPIKSTALGSPHTAASTPALYQ
ncbi:hypothetical protein D3C86_1501500 [compost metagenome]